MPLVQHTNNAIEVGCLEHDSWVPVDVDAYPDGAPLVRHPGVVEGVIDSMILRPRTFLEFTAAMFFVDAARCRSLHIQNLILPFVPGARQDRLNPAGDYLFTLWSVVEMLKAHAFQRIVILDPHSQKTSDLLEMFGGGRLSVTPPWTGWLGCAGRLGLRKATAVIAPDKGASRRAFDTADALGIGRVQAEKVRDVSTGALQGFSVSGLKKDHHYLVVDDICDGGGTFVGLGAKIREAGATASLLVSHAIFSKGTEKLLTLYDRIITTNSTTFPRSGVTEIDVLERLKRCAL